MAARKKPTKKAGSKKVRKKVASTVDRSHGSGRTAPKRARKAAGKKTSGKAAVSVRASAPASAVAGKKRSAAAKNEKQADLRRRREETHQVGKAIVTGGAKKTLNRETNGVAVAEKTNGKVVEAKLSTKSPQKPKAQARSEESALKTLRTDATPVPATKAAEATADVMTPPRAATSFSAKPKPATKDEAATPSKTVKATAGQRQGFRLNEFVVYPAHGVGQIVAIEEQEVAGFKLELFVISFSKDKMTLRVPTSKVVGVGMRKISDPDTAKRSLDILSGRARIKRTMWSRRAQEYETKINSGDITAIAEVVRDLYRSEAQPEQSYSERQLYEAALDRMVREIAAVQKSNEIDALKAIESQLQKTQARQTKASSPEVSDPEIEEAA
jgi:CarD family transcriptional regulator